MVLNFDAHFLLKPTEVITKIIAKTKITPNQITLARFFFLTPPAVYLLSKDQYLTNVIAVLLLYLSAVLDQVDGTLARNYNMKTEVGGWLDDFLNRVDQVVIAMGISWGVFTHFNNDPRWLFMGLVFILSLNIQTYAGDAFKQNYNLYQDTLPKFWKLFEGKTISFWDIFLKDYLAPKSFFYTLISTLSYFIVIGSVLNIMHWMFVVMLLTASLRAITMTYIYIRCILEKDKVSILVSNIKKLN